MNIFRDKFEVQKRPFGLVGFGRSFSAFVAVGPLLATGDLLVIFDNTSLSLQIFLGFDFAVLVGVFVFRGSYAFDSADFALIIFSKRETLFLID